MTDLLSRIEQKLVELGGAGLFNIAVVTNQHIKIVYGDTASHCLTVGESCLYFNPTNLGIALDLIKEASWHPESDGYIINQIVNVQDYISRALEKGFILDATSLSDECLNFFYEFSKTISVTPGRLLAQILQEFKRLHDSEPELAQLIAFNDFSQN